MSTSIGAIILMYVKLLRYLAASHRSAIGALSRESLRSHVFSKAITAHLSSFYFLYINDTNWSIIIRNHAVLDMIPSTSQATPEPHHFVILPENEKDPSLSVRHLLPIRGRANSYKSCPSKQGSQASNLNSFKALSIGSRKSHVQPRSHAMRKRSGIFISLLSHLHYHLRRLHVHACSHNPVLVESLRPFGCGSHLFSNSHYTIDTSSTCRRQIQIMMQEYSRTMQ